MLKQNTQMQKQCQEAFKRFNTAGDQSDLGMDIAAITKREWNMVVAENYSFKNGLDLFGGVGFSGYIYAQCCKKVTVVEKDKSKFELLEKNIGHLQNVELIHDDNLKFLKSHHKNNYDLVDFDPFNQANEQPQHLECIFSKGVLFITSGEITQITRNLWPPSWSDKETSVRYKGKFGAWKWAEEIYIPYLEKKYGINSVVFYSFPSSIRGVFSKDFNINKSLFHSSKYLGWFKKYADLEKRGFKL